MSTTVIVAMPICCCIALERNCIGTKKGIENEKGKLGLMKAKRGVKSNYNRRNELVG